MNNLKLDDDFDTYLKNRLSKFIIKYWDVFREDGVKIPIQGYEMVIDTGDHKPIAVKKPHYGLHESPIMQKTIDWLIDLKLKDKINNKIDELKDRIADDNDIALAVQY